MTRRVAFVNPASGASGDMFLGALVDLGAAVGEIESVLRRLPVPGVRLAVEEVTRRGMRALKVTPAFADGAPAFTTLARVKEALRAADLDPELAREAGRAFERLADAEAEAHGRTPGTVHFHELGSPDTLLDVVGTLHAWRALGIGAAWAGPVNLGGGSVRTAHGELPVPPPAAAALLAGRSVFCEGAEGEKTTPTGALLLAQLCRAEAAAPPFVLERAGCGAGERDFPSRPNCLQILLGREEDDTEGDQVAVLETNLDDLSPQVLAYVIERALAEGAREAFVTPVLMKKGRPGHLVTVVAPAGREAALGALLMRETGTLGYRVRRTGRVVARRTVREVAVPGGTVRIKSARLGGELLRAAPEYEDCRRIAAATGRPLREVIEAALRAAR